MYFVVIGKKPFVVVAEQVYACSLSADTLKVDYSKRLKKNFKNRCRYSLPEVRRYFGLKMIEVYGKKGKVSNATVSSMSEEEQEKE